MRANELMVNDWVGAGYVSRVTGIDLKTDAIRIGGNIGYFKANEHEPIPITPEILEANGFLKKENHTDVFYVVFINSSPVYVGPSIGDKWEVNIYQNGKIEMYIKYVHELQHILRLQGLEKFADEFKLKEGGAQ